LSTWWTTTVKGDPIVGGELSFYFGCDDPSAIIARR
jgi:hypothetical protein